MKTNVCAVSQFDTPVHIVIIGVVLIAVILAGIFALAGCYGGDTYKVDYNGQKDSYQNAQDRYKAGEKVSLVFWLIATDTDYYFTLDGEPINPRYDESKGYVIEFTMPEHDVSLEWDSKNSMVYEPEPDGAFQETMLVDYYTATVATDGGDNSRELVLYYYSDTEVRLSVFYKSDGEDERRYNYIVPREALEKCQEIIKKYKLKDWNDKYEDTGLDCGVTVVKFRQDDGSYIRVSTDCMPDNGEAKMDEIGALLSGYAQDKYNK
ncbi:MAG: hypothetical protein IJ725_06215 [Ruminococcus sp.]|nr:hypothetical protein [Ruminococcus sp.]